MERIRQALKQAEQNRSKLRGSAETADISENAGIHQGARQEPEPVSELSPPPQAVAEEPACEESHLKIVDVSRDVFESNRIVSALPDHELTDVYRVLRTRILQNMNASNWNSLAITSPASGCGKTLTAINLAISLSREINRSVLLADFDLRNPSIHEYFDYQPECGLSDYLLHERPLSDILFSPSIDRLTILPGREAIVNSSEMLRSPQMECLIEELKGDSTERLVLFDLPPILALDDAIAFKPYPDALLLVAEDGETKKDDLLKSIDMLSGTPLIGTVLNKSHSPSARKIYK